MRAGLDRHVTNLGHLPPWAPRRALAEWRELRDHPVYTGEGVADGGGRPIVLVGGFGAPVRAMGALRGWLDRCGYETAVFCWHYGLDCGEATTRALTAELERHARPPILIAHSRGGQFARVAAARNPAAAEALITMGTPFEHIALQPPVLAQAAVLTALGTARVPNLVRLGCVRGGCCAAFRRDLAARWTAPPPLFSIYCPRDNTVKPDTCRDPAATNITIAASHVGMLSSVASYRALARCLHEAARGWR